MENQHSHHEHHEHQHKPPGANEMPAGHNHDHAAMSMGGPTHHKEHDSTGGHDEHAGHHTEGFLKRFWICLVVTVPVLLLSHMIQQWLGIEFTFPGDKYVLLLLSSFIFFYGGWPFLVGLVRELKGKNPGMMTLVAVAITTAYIYSVAVVFGLKGMDFSGNWLL